MEQRPPFWHGLGLQGVSKKKTRGVSCFNDTHEMLVFITLCISIRPHRHPKTYKETIPMR